ncbi:protein tyrosine/serine phosphatase [Chthonomonas calidirosea]|uniref:Protein tyrosine/serine phosphatase n=1 Tax=Chthonomonas calidirosea (strain DSM 23976 / ICMP 18418 / T49) TaxID=1303518 RepID=S0ESD3_CHTCT|nr:tyrosine-protein phosphatase [Chthonomonas calidirosea]CCW34146.1 Protein tyrosine/serine phosphatase [Chthonomonas calidirosea T49]CEK15627.1 protein tyrosine/serine phosphatase [Chthonomonas calidirosea]
MRHSRVWLACSLLVLYVLGACDNTEQGAKKGTNVRAPTSEVTSAENASGLRPALPHATKPTDLNMGALKEAQHTIANVHVVEPFLLRGAAPTAKGVACLKALGIRTVIDLRIAPKHVAAERKLVESAGMHYVNLPMSAEPPTQKEIDTFLTIVRDPNKEPVYVHCQYGADRTGCMVGLYREIYEGWNYQKTYSEMRRYGFKPYLHKLAATVQKYQPGSPEAKSERAKVDALLEHETIKP